jgi:hypothetical protein
MAIRLFNYVLHHKPFVRLGQVPAGYSLEFELEEEKYSIFLDSKGYRYELKNPVTLEVLSGHVRGKQKIPIDSYMPKPGGEYGPDAQFLPDWYVPPSQDTDTTIETDTDAKPTVSTDAKPTVSTEPPKQSP